MEDWYLRALCPTMQMTFVRVHRRVTRFLDHLNCSRFFWTSTSGQLIKHVTVADDHSPLVSVHLIIHRYSRAFLKFPLNCLPKDLCISLIVTLGETFVADQLRADISVVCKDHVTQNRVWRLPPFGRHFCIPIFTRVLDAWLFR